MTTLPHPVYHPRALNAAAHTLGGNRLVARAAQRMGAAVFALVALFVWIAPGAGWDNEVMLLKLMTSMAAGSCAAWLWQSSQPQTPPTIEVDVALSELRLIREGTAQGRQVLERCAFRDLDSVELDGRNITFWGQGQRMLAKISLSNATAHATLLGALRAEGKLA